MAWTGEYDATFKPQSSTPTWTKSGTLDTEEISPAGYLHIARTGSLATYTRTETLALATGVTVEFRLLVNSMDSTTVAADHFVVTIEMGTQYIELNVGDTALYFYSDTTDDTVVFDSTDGYHTYRITKLNSTSNCYVDDVLVSTIVDTDNSSYNSQIQFGIIDGDATVDYLNYSVDGAFPPGDEPDSIMGDEGMTS